MNKGKWLRNKKKSVEEELAEINLYAFAMKPNHPNNKNKLKEKKKNE